MKHKPKSCLGINKKGEQCKAQVVPNSDYCIHHGPRQVEPRQTIKNTWLVNPWIIATIFFVLSSLLAYLLFIKTASKEDLKNIPDKEYLGELFEKNGLFAPDRGELESELNKEFRTAKINALEQFDLGQKYLRIGDLYSAISHLNKAIELAPIPSFYTQLGNCYFRISDYKRALIHYQIAIQLFSDNRITSSKQLLQSNNAIGVIYYLQGNFNEALKYLKNAYHLCKINGYDLETAKTSSYISLAYSAKAFYDEALNFAVQAIDLIDSLNDSSYKSLIYENSGVVYQLISSLKDKDMNLDLAIKYHEKSLLIDRKMRYKYGQASSLGNLGRAYQDKGDLKQALTFATQALDIFISLENKNGIASEYGSMGIIFNLIGEQERALEYFQKALALYRELNSLDALSNILGSIGISYYNLYKYNKAIQYFEQSINIAKKTNNIHGQARQYANISKPYYKLNKIDKSLDCLYKSRDLYNKLKASEEQLMNINNDILVLEKLMNKN